jgi:glycosyltransferase involved in cell wall biosynthesis
MSVRDGEAFVAAALTSILRQTMTDFECVVIDDGSSDGTPALLERAASQDARLRLVRREGGGGLVAALNHGCSLARAPLIARMDADDVALPDRLARQLERLARQPSLVVLGAAAIFVDAQDRPLPADPTPTGLRLHRPRRGLRPVAAPGRARRARQPHRAGAALPAPPAAGVDPPLRRAGGVQPGCTCERTPAA